MSYIYVFGPDDANNDYSTMGLVGALIPTECKFKEVANGESTITLTHPLDDFGRYRYLKDGNILVVPVPVRTTPEIQNGSCVTTVWSYKVKPLNQLTSKAQRTLYKKQTGSGAMKVMNAGDTLTVVFQDQDEGQRWKAKTKYGTGWVDPNGIILVTQYLIPDNPNAIEEIQSPWTITDQYFRIDSVEKTMDAFSVTAKHIRYDLLYNMTRYQSEAEVSLQEAGDGILNNCYFPHEFKFHTNVTNRAAGLMYKRKNQIEAFVNPEEGLCRRFNVGMISDNHDLYFLHDPGINRGVRIQFRKNMLGISFKSIEDGVATRIIPIGEKKDGSDLLLDSDPTKHYIDSPNLGLYPTPRVYELKCENCRVNDKEGSAAVTEAIAKARMRQQVADLLATGCDLPKIEMSVQFINLGDTEEYKQFKNLENAFLFDYVQVQHPDLGIDVTAQIVEINWDVINERMDSVGIGSVGQNLSSTGLTTWQIPSGISGTKLAEGTVGSGALSSDIINARHIQAGSVNADAIQARSLTADKIAANTLTANEISAHTITAGQIAAETITADEISAEAITGDHIKGETIEGRHISANTIGGDKLVANSIEADRIRTGTITAISGIIADIDADVITAGTLSVKRLLLIGEDSVIHQINATNFGLTTEEVTEEDYKRFLDGSIIVAKSITSDQVDTQELFADRAFVDAIEALGFKITMLASESIELVIGTAALPRAKFIFDDNGMAISIPGSTYGTITNNDGYHITQSGEIIASFAKRKLEVENIQAPDGTVVMRRAADGGFMFAPVV